MEVENQKILQKILDEVIIVVKEFEFERIEGVKLKERVVFLENVVIGKEKENQKNEDCYKMLCEKLEVVEIGLVNGKVEWVKEKIVWEEKERFLQSVFEVMKNDFKVL